MVRFRLAAHQLLAANLQAEGKLDPAVQHLNAAIELVGDADLANESWGFSVGDNGASRIGDIVWFGPLKPIQNVFMRTPLVNLFILGSETYHDYYRWALRDKRVFEAWTKKTTWGHMKIRIPGARCGPEDTGVEDEVADFASVDMTGTLRAEKPSQHCYSPIASHRHTQNVCRITGRGHPNAH